MYWDEIWEAADTKRISAYVKKLDLAPDDIIRYLHKRGAVSVCVTPAADAVLFP